MLSRCQCRVNRCSGPTILVIYYACCSEGCWLFERSGCEQSTSGKVRGWPQNSRSVQLCRCSGLSTAGITNPTSDIYAIEGAAEHLGPLVAPRAQAACDKLFSYDTLKRHCTRFQAGHDDPLRGNSWACYRMENSAFFIRGRKPVQDV